MKYVKLFEDFNDKEMVNLINKSTNFEKEMKKRKINNHKIKLGDYVTIGTTNKKNGNRTYDLWLNSKYFRCISVNPNVVIQEVINDELTDCVVTLTDKQVEKAQTYSAFYEEDKHIANSHWKIEQKDM